MTEETKPSQNIRDNLSGYCDIQNKGGSLPLYILTIGTQYYKKEFIQRCLDEIDRIPMRVALGDNPSNLEKLAYDLLCVGSFTKTGDL